MGGMARRVYEIMQKEVTPHLDALANLALAGGADAVMAERAMAEIKMQAVSAAMSIGMGMAANMLTLDKGPEGEGDKADGA
jgi:hypothetical protein